MESPAIQRNDSVSVREVDGELLLLDTQALRIHQLNRTASVIWRMHEEGAAPQAIASALAVQFDVDEATALGDVSLTLTSLRSLSLLVGERRQW